MLAVLTQSYASESFCIIPAYKSSVSEVVEWLCRPNIFVAGGDTSARSRLCMLKVYMVLLILVSNRRRSLSPANGFISLYTSSPRNGAQAVQRSALRRSALRRRRCGEQGVLSFAPRPFWGVLLHHVCLGVLGISVMSTRSCTEVSTSCSDRLVSCTLLLLLSIAGVAGED